MNWLIKKIISICDKYFEESKMGQMELSESRHGCQEGHLAEGTFDLNDK